MNSSITAEAKKQAEAPAAPAAAESDQTESKEDASC